MDLVRWFVYHTGGKVYIRLILDNKQEVVLTNLYPQVAERFALDVVGQAWDAKARGRGASENPPAHPADRCPDCGCP